MDDGRKGLGGILVNVAAEGFVAVVGSAVIVDRDVGVLGVGELDGGEAARKEDGRWNGGAFFIPDFKSCVHGCAEDKGRAGWG